MKKKILISFLLIIIFSIFTAAGFYYFNDHNNLEAVAQKLQLDDQTATIMSIKKVIPAVVSIIIYNQEQALSYDLSTGNSSIIKQRVEKGRGTGILISADGYILTNKHVANAAPDSTAEYRIILNSGKEYYAQFIGLDPIYDLAVFKIFDKNLPFVELGDSDSVLIGTTVIAIGNALGRYQNSATKGIVSALGRSLMAGDQQGSSEILDNVIQTDAEINLGNSGGPLIDLEGKVVGINVAVDLSGSSIGFAIPINDARPIIKSVRDQGQIIRPKLGLLYKMLTSEIARDNNLSRDSGAWVTKGDDGSAAVMPNSPAEKAGVREGDIIFEINGIKLAGNKSLLSVVQKYKPGERIGLKIQRGSQSLVLVATLGKF